MPISTYPATGGSEVWVPISSATPSSGGTYTVSNLGAYKKLRIVINNVTSLASTFHKVRLNGDAGSNYYYYNSQAANASINVGADGFNGGSASSANCDLTFEFIQAAGAVRVTGWWGALYGASLTGLYMSSAAITSLSFVLGSGTFPGTGVVQVYGVAA